MNFLTEVPSRHTVAFFKSRSISLAGSGVFHFNGRSDVMKFVKVKDEERPGDVAINLDLVREAHFGGGLLRLYFERGASQDDMTFTGENAKTIWAAMG